jgi:anti-sigma28 factor (negative regulator of flagellin synthesis)
MSGCDMKTVNIEVDWLDKINRLTVADAIDYLKTLNQLYKLTAYPDGDDLQGVEHYSGLYYEREETKEELRAIRVCAIKKKIKDCEYNISYRNKEINAGYNIEHHTVSLGKSVSTLEALNKEQLGLGVQYD